MMMLKMMQGAAGVMPMAPPLFCKPTIAEGQA